MFKNIHTQINAPEPRCGKSITTNAEEFNWVFGFQIDTRGDHNHRLFLQPLSYSSSSVMEAERGNSKSNQAGPAGTPSKGSEEQLAQEPLRPHQQQRIKACR